MNQYKIYFISGVSGVGKTSTLEQLKRLLPANIFDVCDFDERGVPDGGGPAWHDNETLHWLDIAALNAANNKNTVITGFINPEQFKKIYNPDSDIPAQIILLDVSADILRKRLYGRHATPKSKREIERAAGVVLDEFVEQCVSFAPKLHLIFEQNNFPIVDTDNKMPKEVAREIVNLVIGKHDHIIERESFLESIKTYDIVWFGEIHGIQENYLGYKDIIPFLVKSGFKNIVWEMDSDFSEKSTYSEDARINPYAISFLQWLHNGIDEHMIDRLTFFGTFIHRKDAYDYPNDEEKMAEQIIENIKDAKSIVISGNFHMGGGPANSRKRNKPCLYFVQQKTGLKIAKIGLKYAGGNLYNFGIKHMTPNFYFGDLENLPLGTITKALEEDTFFLSVGEAHEVFKNPTIRKESSITAN